MNQGSTWHGTDRGRAGLTPQPTTRAELAEFMKKEDVKWSAIVRERKISAN